MGYVWWRKLRKENRNSVNGVTFKGFTLHYFNVITSIDPTLLLIIALLSTPLKEIASTTSIMIARFHPVISNHSSVQFLCMKTVHTKLLVVYLHNAADDKRRGRGLQGCN